MRQFILASDYGDSVSQVKLINDKTLKTANLVLKRDVEKGGDVLYPIYPKDLTIVSAKFSDANMKASTFKAVVTLPEIESDNDYTIIFVKKGKQFNERNKWTCSVRAKNTDTATTIGDKFVEWGESTKVTLGLVITNSDGELTITGPSTGEDYGVILADSLGAGPLDKSKITIGKPAFMDATMVKDLAAKCAAGAGFEYTHDELEGLYPTYPIDPLAQPNAIDTGFDVYTIRFTEPRLMGTREEAVYQIIQVAFPSGKGAGIVEAMNEFIGVTSTASAASVESGSENSQE